MSYEVLESNCNTTLVEWNSIAAEKKKVIKDDLRSTLLKFPLGKTNNLLFEQAYSTVEPGGMFRKKVVVSREKPIRELMKELAMDIPCRMNITPKGLAIEFA